MKRILALVMVLAMVFAFAACKNDKTPDADESTNANGEVIDTDGDDDANAPVDGDDASTPADESTEANGDAEPSTDANGNAVETNKADGSATPNKPSGSQSTTLTTAEIVANYVKARKATKPAPAGKQTMELGNGGKINGDGMTGFLFSAASGIINNVLKDNSTATDYIPAASHADLKASDCKSAKCKVSADGKYTDYIIYLKEQTDGATGDSHNGGPVARGVGTLGNIDEALNQLNASFSSGKENVKLTYANAYIKARVDNKTGMIVNGSYYYLVKINISEAKITMVGISASVKNMYGEVVFNVTVGGGYKGQSF